MIIGISGRIGSGKDTVGDIIRGLRNNSYGQSPWQIKKFAGKLKQIVSILTGIPTEDLEKQSVKDRVLGPEWERSVSPLLSEDLTCGVHRVYGPPVMTPYTVREVLQRVGTEAMRDQIHPNIWVNALFSDYKAIPHNQMDDFPTMNVYPQWIITDVRFPNEAQAIKDRGGIMIRVVRVPDQKAADFHTSETALDDYNFDEVIYNTGTIEDLKEKVRQVLTKHNL